MGVDSHPDHATPAATLGATRTRVLTLLQDSPEPLSAPEVAGQVGVHVNTARFHLDALTGLGLVSRAAEDRSGPGRPRVRYQAAAAAPAGPGRHRYQFLATILATSLRDALPDVAADSVRVGEEWGRYLAPRIPPSQPRSELAQLAEVAASLDELGFRSVVTEEAGTPRLEITRCPVHELAETHGDVVCSIHLGLIRGALAGSGLPADEASLTRHARPGLCVARLSPDGAVSPDGHSQP